MLFWPVRLVQHNECTGGAYIANHNQQNLATAPPESAPSSEMDHGVRVRRHFSRRVGVIRLTTRSIDRSLFIDPAGEGRGNKPREAGADVHVLRSQHSARTPLPRPHRYQLRQLLHQGLALPVVSAM